MNLESLSGCMSQRQELLWDVTMMGAVLQPMAYLSKQLDKASRQKATALMVKEASKLTLGQPTTVHMQGHQVQAVFETKGIDG